MLSQVIRVITIGSRIVGGAALVLLMTLFCVDVVARYFFRAPIDGVLEITTTLLLPLVVFVGMCLAVPDDVHVRMGVIYDRLPSVPRTVLNGIAGLLAAGLWGWIAFEVGDRALQSMLAHEVSTVSFALPIFWGYLVVAVGSALMAVVSFLHVFVAGPASSDADPALEGI